MKITTENEITEMWREHKKACQEKRASNRADSAQILMDKGIEFESKNGCNDLCNLFNKSSYTR